MTTSVENPDRSAGQIKDYRLTTAEILYHMPDHPAMLQSYIWQALDIAPAYPALHKFLEFWRRELDGRLHSVRVGSLTLVKPPVAQGGGLRAPRLFTLQ